MWKKPLDNIVVDTKAFPVPATADDAEVLVHVGDSMAGVSALADLTVPEDRQDLAPAKQIRFEGAWLPAMDGTEIGPGNYQVLTNCRYKPKHLEGVLGYEKFNWRTMYAVPGGIYPVYFRFNAIHQILREGASYLLVHMSIPGAVGHVRVAEANEFTNLNNLLFIDSEPDLYPRFGATADGQVLYCNGKDPCQIWAGREMRLGAFIEEDFDPVDPTKIIYSDHSDDIHDDFLETRTFIDTGHRYYVGSTRQLEGITCYGDNPCNMAGVEEFRGGASWQAVGVNTSLIAPNVYRISWADTGLSKPLYFRDYHLYWYRIQFQPLSTGFIDKITANAPMQPLTNLWDGIDLQPISFIVKLENPERINDYTIEVNEVSSDQYPVGAVIESWTLGGMVLNGELLVAFEVPVTGIRFRMTAGHTNQCLCDFDLYGDVENIGWALIPAAMVTDGTAPDGSQHPLGQTGVISWYSEITYIKRERYGVTGYWYRIKFDGPLYNRVMTTRTNVYFDEIYGKISHDGVPLFYDGFRIGDVVEINGSDLNDGPKTIVALENGSLSFYVAEPLVNEAGTPVKTVGFTANRDIIIDAVSGISKEQPVKVGQFAGHFGDRVFLAIGNTFEYSSPGATDVWNGELSSMNGIQTITVGSNDDIICAAQIYNRFGSSIYGMYVVLKRTETYIIIGDNPNEYNKFPVSYNVGCPAPYTLAVAELGYQMAEMTNRNIAIWLSFTGPYVIDGAILSPIPGIENFFDKSKQECINFDAIHKAIGWYDQEHFEYNLCFPSGTAQECNTWVAYDLLKQKWAQRFPGGRSFPQSACVASDGNGVKFVYAGCYNGHVVRLEQGTTWNDVQEWNAFHDYPTGYLIWNRFDGRCYSALFPNRDDIPPGPNWEESGPPGIIQVVRTGDIYASDDFWNQVILRRVMVFCQQITENRSLEMYHFVDTRAAMSVPAPAPPNVTPGPIGLLPLAQGTDHRVLRLVQACNHTGWTHCLEFRAYTSDTHRGVKLLAYGVQAWVERMEE